MLDQEFVYKVFLKSGVDFFTGVPDSYLNGFCNYLLKHVEKEKHIIAANEGNAVSIAAGYYFATQKVPLVYMQNSGIGNALNPLVSMIGQDVYAVPMVLLIGWRGQPGMGDWAQHKLQGEITLKLMELMQIPYVIVKDDQKEIGEVIKTAVADAKQNRRPFALIAPKGVFAGEKKAERDAAYPMSREEAIETVLDQMPKETVYTATTGRATRELFFLRKRRGERQEHDFLNVGSMGHVSSVSFGIAIARRGRTVVCLDGDSAAIMHMGFMTTLSKYKVPGFFHIVLNNGAHESVGGQPSAGYLIDFTQIASACGYATYGNPVKTKEEIIAALSELKKEKKAAFLDVRIHKGLMGELPPLRFQHREAIDHFIKELTVEGSGKNYE